MKSKFLNKSFEGRNMMMEVDEHGILWFVIESPCTDGQYRPTTYATKKGLEYLRKILHKDGYYQSEGSMI